MRTSHPVIPVSGRISALALAGLLIAGCEKPAPPVMPPPVVQVIEVAATEIPVSATLIGQLDSPQNVEIRARVEAFVEKIHFKGGTKIKQGDPLFELDKRPFIEKLAAANADLAKAESAQVKANSDLERFTKLAGTGAVSQLDLDNATAAKAAAISSVASAKARVESCQLDLGYCEVRAPITGLIGDKEVSVGDLVGKGQPTLLATMSSLDPIWFHTSLTEATYIRTQTRAREMNRDLTTLPLTLQFSDGGTHPDKGKIVFFDRAVDPKTGTMRMRAEFPNPTEILRPGMFARAVVDGGTRKGILLPERAVSELQGRTFVWIVDKDRTAHQRPVKTGDTHGSEVVILDGLQPGESVILEGVQKVREGAPVTLLPSPQAAAAPAPAPTKP